MKYRTIVADPPWDHSDGTGFSFGERDPRGRSGRHAPTSHSLPYGTMTVAEITDLRPPAATDAHLYLWTTNRYLQDAYSIVEAWGFGKPIVLVWCKPPNQGLFGGQFLSNVEFVLFARRGAVPIADKCGSRWFTWPRGEHSAKPEAFLDLVETVSPGPYLELFARRQRLGWDTWGDEALDHVGEALA